MEQLWQDVRYGIRGMLQQRGYTLIAVIALAIGIGGNTAIFSLVNSILLRQLPFKDPKQLVMIFSRRPDPGKRPFNLPDFIDYRNGNRSLAGIAAFGYWSATLTGRGNPEQLQGMRISANAFQMLGVNAVAGRVFRAADDTPGEEHLVLLSHKTWQRRFGADRSVIGRTLTLNGAAYTVIGVLPRQFLFPIRDAELAVPLAPDSDPSSTVRTSSNTLRALARLKTGVTPEQAEADLTALALRIRQEFPVANQQKIGVTIRRLQEEVVGDFRLALWTLLAAVGAVLLITCVNLANLALVRASARSREIAVRTALGATRARLIRQLATETLLLALLGGSAGVALAFYGIRLLVLLSATSLPRMAEVGIDFRVLAFSLTLSLLAGVLFGLAPAVQATRMNLSEELKEKGRGGIGGAKQSRSRAILVVLEIALSLVLLIGAGLLIKSFHRLQMVNPGFNAENVLTARLSLPKLRYTNRLKITAFYKELQSRLESLPGVKAAGFISILPFSGLLSSVPFTIEGRSRLADEAILADYRLVNAGYFRAMQIPLIAGRLFNEHDTSETIPVALISRNFARRYWQNTNPLGVHLLIDDNDQGPRPVEIIGVVGDVKNLSLDADPSLHIYLPLAQVHEDHIRSIVTNQYWLLRTDVDPLTLQAAIRREIQKIDRDVPASNMQSMAQYLSASVAPRRFNLRLLTVFAAAALFLAATGLYGVISFGMAQRKQEIGIRMALGAARIDVLKLVVIQGMRLALIGVAAGVIASLAATRLLKSLLYNVSTTDLPTFGVIALLLIIVALFACYLPARRAAAIDPIVAMK